MIKKKENRYLNSEPSIFLGFVLSAPTHTDQCDAAYIKHVKMKHAATT